MPSNGSTGPSTHPSPSSSPASSSRRQRDHRAAGLVRHLRGRLLHAPGGRLAAGHFLRPLRPQGRAGPDHPDDGRRLADHRRHSHLRHHRPGRPAAADRRAPAARPVAGRRVCLGHDLPGGNGAVQPPWFLFQLRVLQRRRRHPGRVRRGLGADVHPDQARDGRLGLAHSVPAGRAGRPGRPVDPPLHPGNRSLSHSKKAGVEKQPLRNRCASIRWKCCASSASPS